MNYSGEERRRNAYYMDAELRDKIIETNTEVKNINLVLAAQKEELEKHTIQDDKRFAQVMWIGMAVLAIVIANGGLSALHMIFTVKQ